LSKKTEAVEITPAIIGLFNLAFNLQLFLPLFYGVPLNLVPLVCLLM
jgi:hypothetical protein